MSGFGSVESKFTSLYGQLITHIREPLYRNGYALVLGTASTSALGFIYWAVAARQYSTEIIGINSAIIAMMTFLSEMSQLNLTSALNRFVPIAGKRTKPLVGNAYLISLVAGLGASLLFLFGINIWAQELSFLKTNLLLAAAFILATMGWNIFTLQDSVLIGMRKATWVPVENILFSLLKLGLLIGFVWWYPQYGVFISWILPLIVFIPIVNILIYVRLIPQHVNATIHSSQPIEKTQITRFVSGNYFSNLISTATASLIPLIILAQVGATANAYYYISWTVTYSLYLFSYNMGMSFITEATSNRKKYAHYRYQTLTQTAYLLTPIVILLVVGAPFLLKIFGASYATEGLTLFRLLCLSALPKIITTNSVDAARVEQRLRTIILVPAVLGGSVLTLSLVLLKEVGITGVGVAWLAGQTLIAIFLLITDWRTTVFPFVDIQNMLTVLSFPRKLRERWRQRKSVRLGTQLLPKIVPSLRSKVNDKTETPWRVQRNLSKPDDLINLVIGPDQNPLLAIMKIPQSEQELGRLNRHYQMLKILQENNSLGEWQAYLPEVYPSFDEADRKIFVERLTPGVDASQFLTKKNALTQMQSAAFAAIRPLHQKTASTLTIDIQWLNKWLDTPRNTLQDLLSAKSITPEAFTAYLQLENQIRDNLLGREIVVSWIHGDFVPQNIKISPDGSQVVGILDWELAAQQDLPQLDLYHFLIVCRSLVSGNEYGESVAALLDGEKWSRIERELLESSNIDLPGERIEPHTLTLMSWLRHISGNLSKTPRYNRQWWWIGRNIEEVLRNV